MERLIMFTGKGGVGKTSLAAAHALASARAGQRTLLASMDAAHNLSDLFETPIAPEPLAVEPNLDIVEVDANRVREQDYRHVSETLARMIAPEVSGDSDEVLDVPGVDPLFFLLKVDGLVAGYDRVILDLAPTGETLSLLQLPELLEWWMEHLFGLQKIAVRALRPIAKRMWQLELPDARAMNDIEALYARLRRIEAMLKNPELSSVRLVTLPERMVIEETKRSSMYLNLFGYSVDHVFVNGVLPAEGLDDFFRGWLASQEEHLAEIEATFPHLPITRVPRFPSDLRGNDAVARLAEAVLDADAFAVRPGLDHERYESVGDGYVLHLSLPLADKGEVRLSQTPDDLVVRIGNTQRNIPLPATLHDFAVTGARYADDHLAVTFAKENTHE